MRKLTWLLLLAALFQHCTTKKIETANTIDSVSVDSVLTTSPAPSLLAYSPISGFSLDNKFVFTDTVNYFLLSSQEEFDKRFHVDKAASGKAFNPNFVINYNIAVACMPTTDLTTIVMDKVELGAETIDVYLTIQRGEKQKFLTKPSQLFAIERRDGLSVIQFYVNGKQDKSISLAITQ